MKIGIINAGNIGRTLAKVWNDAGHDLMLAKAGDQTKLTEFLPTVSSAQAGRPRDAVEFGDVVLFSVYWPRLEETLEEVGDLSGKIVIDTMNPLNVNDKFEHYHDVDFMKESSTSEELQRRQPGARVVKAFSTMPSPVLDASEWRDNVVSPPIFVASDDQEAKEVVMQLARDAGFEPFDSGPLESSRSIDQMGILLHHVGTHHFGGDYSRLAPTILRANEHLASQSQTKEDAMTNQRNVLVRGPADGEKIYAGGDLYRFLAKSGDTDGCYAIWEAIVPPGGGPPPHLHRNEEEGFYVISGEVAVYADGEKIEAKPGAFVQMPKGSKHWFRNESDQDAKMLVLVAPGGMEGLFESTGTAVTDANAPIPPLSDEEKQRIIEAAPRFGIEISHP